jgi:hypothetical protein
MPQPLCGHPQAVKVHKNERYNCSICYGRSDCDLTLWCYKCMLITLIYICVCVCVYIWH